MAIQEQQRPHFALLPLMAQGHTLPMIDIARLLAKRGVIVTILTTRHNATKFETVINRAINSGLNIHLLHMKFPSVEAGLPQGCEHFDAVHSIDDVLKFFKATALLQTHVQELLQELKPSPNCLISDSCLPWTTNVALNLNIPRIMFHGMSCFAYMCFEMLVGCKDFEGLTSDTEYYAVPGLPDRIEITKAQLSGAIIQFSPEWKFLLDQMKEAEVKAFGWVSNSFEELEPDYVKEQRRIKGKKLWCIGPVSLCNEDDKDKAERGYKSSLDEHCCLKWLDSREPGSVLYFCLGSFSGLATSQLIELGLGLEASNRPFIWVVRDQSGEFRKWVVEEKYEERIKDRGLMIHGWAPQVLILSHPSVGGFVTHCGWNSTIEGITAGVPLITWPTFSEQFCNEKFIVNVIRTGIRMGVEVPVAYRDDEKAGVLVKNDEIRLVIDKLMDGGEDGEERRKRARKLGGMAKRAMKEGGSSYRNLDLLIEDIITYEANDYGI